MGVVEAKVQTWKRFIGCSGLLWRTGARLLPAITDCRGCFAHRLGRNKEDELRVLCYQYGGESERSSAGGFAGQLALHCAGETQSSEVVAGRWLVYSGKPFTACLLRCQT